MKIFWKKKNNRLEFLEAHIKQVEIANLQFLDAVNTCINKMEATLNRIEETNKKVN